MLQCSKLFQQNGVPTVAFILTFSYRKPSKGAEMPARNVPPNNFVNLFPRREKGSEKSFNKPFGPCVIILTYVGHFFYFFFSGGDLVGGGGIFAIEELAKFDYVIQAPLPS